MNGLGIEGGLVAENAEDHAPGIDHDVLGLAKEESVLDHEKEEEGTYVVCTSL